MEREEDNVVEGSAKVSQHILEDGKIHRLSRVQEGMILIFYVDGKETGRVDMETLLVIDDTKDK